MVDMEPTIPSDNDKARRHAESMRYLERLGWGTNFEPPSAELKREMAASASRRYKLKPVKNGDWIVEHPDGEQFIADYDLAISHITTVARGSDAEVWVLDGVGLIQRVVHISPQPQAAVPQTTAAQPGRPWDEATPSNATKPSVGEFRLFIQGQPSTEPFQPWSDWRVRPGPVPDCLEIEAAIDETLTGVCYLTTDDHGGLVSFAVFGDMLDPFFQQAAQVMETPRAAAVLKSTSTLFPLMTQDVVDDAGLGSCLIGITNDPASDGGHVECRLIWTDGQPAALGISPHSRFLVQRTFHIALGLLADLLLVEQAFTTAGPDAGGTDSFWKQTEHVLEILDTNLPRAARIFDALADIFGS